MARIRSIAKGTQSIRAHSSEVDCFYNLIDDNGTLLIHLSTFGSDQRKSAPKSSQSIQLDEAMAAQLIDVLREAFPKLATSSRRQTLPPASGRTGSAPIYDQLAKRYGTE